LLYPLRLRAARRERQKSRAPFFIFDALRAAAGAARRARLPRRRPSVTLMQQRLCAVRMSADV